MPTNCRSSRPGRVGTRSSIPATAKPCSRLAPTDGRCRFLWCSPRQAGDSTRVPRLPRCELDASVATSSPPSRSRWPTPMRRRSTSRRTPTARRPNTSPCVRCPLPANAMACTGRRCLAKPRARLARISPMPGRGRLTTVISIACSPHRVRMRQAAQRAMCAMG